LAEYPGHVGLIRPVNWSKTVTSQITPNIVIEKINLDRFCEFYEIVIESRNEWFAAGMIPQPDLSIDELEWMVRAFLILWEKDDTYMFCVIDSDINRMVGTAFLNRMNRMRQFANLGYSVRTSRVKQGIAPAAAKLVVRYGFEKLGLQRIEVVIDPDNIASLKVVEKLGAVREGLLRNGMRIHGIPCNAYLYSLIPSDLGITNTAACGDRARDKTHDLRVFFHRILHR
jgi:RimJ/RimL family protein N-acetyltransferase